MAEVAAWSRFVVPRQTIVRIDRDLVIDTAPDGRPASALDANIQRSDIGDPGSGHHAIAPAEPCGSN